MASVPNSKAYGQKLTKATDLSKHKNSQSQIKEGGLVKAQTKTFFQKDFARICGRKINVDVKNQAVRIYNENGDPAKLREK